MNTFILSLRTCLCTEHMILDLLTKLSFNTSKYTRGLDALLIFPFLVIDDNLD
jgi:hypothetical protein